MDTPPFRYVVVERDGERTREIMHTNTDSLKFAQEYCTNWAMIYVNRESRVLDRQTGLFVFPQKG